MPLAGSRWSTPPRPPRRARAVYTIASGQIVLTGDVLLTQGQNVMSGQKLTVDLKTGTGAMDGRMRTILQPGGN